MLLLCWIAATAVLAAEEAPDDDADRPQLSAKDAKLLIAGMRANSKDKNALIRAAAARDLPILESMESIEIAHKLLGDEEPFVRNAALQSVAGWSDEESLGWLAADGRRKGSVAQRALVVQALGLVKNFDLVRDALRADVASFDEPVQAAAIIALADQGDKESLPSIVACVDDQDAGVREAVAEALGSIGTGADMDAMRKLLADPEWEVRAAMIKAAERLAIKPVVSLLISRLPEEEGRLREDLRSTLVQLTGQDFGLDPDLWISWWDANKSEYGVTEKIEIRVTKNDYGETTEYYGIKIYSTRVLFVLDTSESMGGPANSLTNNKVKDRQVGGKQRVYKGTTKLELAKEELSFVVGELADNVYFNVVSFNTEINNWKPAPVQATAANKSSAQAWIKKLSPKANGATNIHGALMEALGVTGKSAAQAARSRKLVDSIYLLADGEPTYGKLTDPVDILREVRFANPDARIAIHAIRLGTLGNSKFMVDLATQNGGSFVEIN